MAAATSSGWATAVSRISSASAVVPHLDQVAADQVGPGRQAVGETRQLKPRGEEPRGLGTLTGGGDNKHCL